jgi:hypothetical protein
VALSESTDVETIEFSHRQANGDLQWFIDGITFDDWSDSSVFTKSITFDTPESLQNNGTFWAHVLVVPHKANPTTVRKTPAGKRNIYMYACHPLTKMLTLTTGTTKKNLLSSDSDKDAAIEPVRKTLLSHWKGNYTIGLVTDFNVFPQGGIPPQVVEFFRFDESGDFYFPIVWQNDFWILREDFMPLNKTVSQLTLDMRFEPISLIKFSIFAQLSTSFSMQRDLLGKEEGESEEFKRMLIDNPPWLLALTFTISIVHSVLDILAFKNEITFWKDRKSMKGLSLKTIYINIISNIIVFLYLWDNDTNWMILLSAGAGTLIEMWKITKAATVTFSWRGRLPWITVTDKQSYSSTKQFDDEAMKYLIWAIYPIVVLYAGYSLMYEDHKSWYSFIIGTLAGCVYTFGFIMMTPQLFINYRLKSVAHLPWRAFVYKGINTFIDDLFAFIIRMPTMHRLRCFRDDLIFVIYLYQRWIYPIDRSRVEVLDGEMGESADAAEIEAAKAAHEEKQKRLKDAPNTSEAEKNVEETKTDSQGNKKVKTD